MLKNISRALRSYSSAVNTVYFGNISAETSVKSLSELVSECGAFDSIRINSSFANGQQKIFAMINFDNAQSAEKAVSLNGSNLDGRSLAVQLSQNTGATRVLSLPPSRTLFLGNMPWTIEKETIEQFCSVFGSIESIKMPTKAGKPSGVAFVSFESLDSAQEALKGLTGKKLDSRLLRVGFAKDQVETELNQAEA